jgi:hypothetical protein
VKKRADKDVTLTKAQKFLLEWLYASAMRLDDAVIEGLTQPKALLLVLQLFIDDLQVLQQASDKLSEEG